jgi:RNA polymerase sigma-B factor
MSPVASSHSLSKNSGSAVKRDLDSQVQPALDRMARLPGGDPARKRLRNDVVERAMPLADRLARRFEHRGESIDDLTQVARLGLVKSVNNFNAERGTGFTRFAVPSILGEIKRHFRDKGWLIKVPRRLQETRLALNSASRELSQKLGREPTVEDFAEYLSIPVAQVRAGMDCVGAYDGVSLQAPAHRDSDAQVADSIGAADPDMACVETRQSLRPLIMQLSARERRILAMRFGEDLTQSQIADRVGLSQMHVSRLLRQSLAKLRQGLDA